MTARSLAMVVALTLVCAAARLDAQLISQPTAMRHGLTRAWYNQVPIDTSRAKLAHWVLHKDLLLVQTSAGLLTAIDAETGGTRWTNRLSKDGAPSAAPAANDTTVCAVCGDMLYVYDRITGRTLWDRKLASTVNSGLVMNEERVFFIMSNGWMESFTLEDNRKGEWHYASKGGSYSTPVLTRDAVAWANDRGLLNASQFDAAKLTFQFETDMPMAGGLAFQPPFIFMGVKDDNIYAIGARRGRKLGQVIWRFYTGGVINFSPAPIGNNLYVSTSDAGMYCLKIGYIADSAEARKKGAVEAEIPAGGLVEQTGGTPIWWQSRAYQFLAASKTRVYASDVAGRLLILDGKSGAIQGSLLIPELNRRLANTQTDRIFLANNEGFVQCLRETDLVKPLLHLAPDDAEAAPKREIKKGGAVGEGEEKKEEEKKEEEKKAE